MLAGLKEASNNVESCEMVYYHVAHPPFPQGKGGGRQRRTRDKVGGRYMCVQMKGPGPLKSVIVGAARVTLLDKHAVSSRPDY